MNRDEVYLVSPDSTRAGLIPCDNPRGWYALRGAKHPGADEIWYDGLAVGTWVGSIATGVVQTVLNQRAYRSLPQAPLSVTGAVLYPVVAPDHLGLGVAVSF